MGNLRLPGCQDRRRFPVRETEEPFARAHEKAGALDPYPDVMELSPTCNGIESAGRRAITDEVVSRRILQHLPYASGDIVEVVDKQTAGFTRQEAHAIL